MFLTLTRFVKTALAPAVAAVMILLSPAIGNSTVFTTEAAFQAAAGAFALENFDGLGPHGTSLTAPPSLGVDLLPLNMAVARPELVPMVGFARTATYRSAQPSTRSAQEVQTQRAAYYEYVEAGDRPTISVLQDLDPEPGFGAFWGEVNSTIHSALGAIGGITNGSIRDLDALAPGFQLLAGKIGPSHAYGHLVDFGNTVDIFGMEVADNDLIHADRHGGRRHS